MKICKNNSDIILYPVTKCSSCAFDTGLRPCLWLKVVDTHSFIDCGGIESRNLSDIFRL